MVRIVLTTRHTINTMQITVFAVPSIAVQNSDTKNA